jgi:hypothetical protein
MPSIAANRLERLTDCFAAGFALSAIALHDAAHVREGHYYHAFWICNVAALLVGPALLARSATLSAVALTWLMPGTIVWLVDTTLTGVPAMSTSYGVHFGGALAAVWGVRRFGYARGSWRAALAVLAVVLGVSRLFLPAEPNVNAVQRVPAGWGFLGGSRAGFVLCAALLIGLVCVAGQLVARALAKREV